MEAPCLEFDKLAGNRAGVTSDDVRKRVTAARKVQCTRFENVPRPEGASPLYTNAGMGATKSASSAPPVAPGRACRAPSIC